MYLMGIVSKAEGNSAGEVAATTAGVVKSSSSSSTPPKACPPAPRSPRATCLSCLARLPRPLVMTNGVFDLLHRGHVAYLEAARALGASLAVAVNSDASVKRLGKGGDRPFNTLDDRMAVLAGLASVDLVVPFEGTRRGTSSAALPDVLVKGGDYNAETTAGAAEVMAAGGASSRSRSRSTARPPRWWSGSARRRL